MMMAKQEVIVNINLPNGVVKCKISIPFWWEEQECKRRSIIRDDGSSSMYLDKSNFHRRMADLIIESVEVNGSCKEKDPNKVWSERLKHNIIKPLNDAYEKMCSEEMLNFKEEVEMFLSFEKRPEGTFIAPPEVIEYMMMKRVGGLTRQDIRSMSYVEMHKFQIIGNAMAEKSSGVIAQSQNTSDQNPFNGLIPAELMQDPTLSPDQVKMMSNLSSS